MGLDEGKEEEDKEDEGMCWYSWSHEEEENATALPSRKKESNVSNTRNLPPSTNLN